MECIFPDPPLVYKKVLLHTRYHKKSNISRYFIGQDNNLKFANQYNEGQLSENYLPSTFNSYGLHRKLSS